MAPYRYLLFNIQIEVWEKQPIGKLLAVGAWRKKSNLYSLKSGDITRWDHSSSSLDSNLCQHEIQDRFWLLCLTPYMLFSSSGINFEILKHFSFWSLFCKGLYQWGGKQTVKGRVGSSFMPGRRNKCFKTFRQLLSLGVLSAQCPNSRLFSVFSFPWEGNLYVWARFRSLSGVIRFWGRIIKVQDHGTSRGVSPQLSWVVTW